MVPASPLNTREESFKRLRAEAWKASKPVAARLADGKAVFQLLKDGSGDYVYDEYSGLVETMPKDTTPEAFLAKMLSDLNATVNDVDSLK